MKTLRIALLSMAFGLLVWARFLWLAQAQTPNNFPNGIYNGCQGQVAASAGMASAVIATPCWLLHGCLAQDAPRATPASGDILHCAIATFPAIVIQAGATVTATSTGVAIIYSTANANATAFWMGY